MPPSNEPRGRFEEQAALEELERLRRALEQSRERRKHANEEFDTFLRSFERRPAAPATDAAEPAEQPRFARAPDPRPRDLPQPPAPTILSRRPDRPSSEPRPVVERPPAVERAPVIEPDPALPPTSVQPPPPALPAVSLQSAPALPAAITGAIDRDEERLSDLPSEAHAVPAPAAASTGVASIEERREETTAVPHAVRAEHSRRPLRDPRIVAVLAVVVLAAVFLVYRALSHSGPGTPASGQQATQATAEPAPSAARPAQRPAPTPPAVPPARVQLTTTRLVWVRVTADGVKTVERELPPGTTIPIDADESIVVRAGDAGAVRMVIDGKDQGPLGPDGVVRTRAFTPPR